MNWDEEKKIYIHKLEKVINGIRQINDLEGNRLITSEMKRDLEKLSAEANKILPKLVKGEFSIAVVGLEKAGKSSFANALTDLSVLPTDDQRCTYTSTCIRPSEQDSATIEFYSQAEFGQGFTEKLAKLEIPNAEKYNPSVLQLKKYEELYAATPEHIQQGYGDNLNLDIRDILENWDELKKYVGHAPLRFNGKELESEEFASFIKNPARAVAVKDVTIYSTQLRSMPNAVLYDVPGFDSPTAMHRAQTLEKMSEADAIIMVAAANKPSLTSPALNIFSNHDNYGCTLDKKMFVFANKADAVATAEKLQENMEVTWSEWMVKRKLLSSDHKDRIIFGSANAHLGEKVPGGIEAAVTLKKYGLTSGILDLRKKLVAYYENDRFEVLKNRINTILNDVLKVFSDIDGDFDHPSSFAVDASHNLVLDTYTTLREELHKNLDEFKHKSNKQINSKKPLSKAVFARIVQSITCENYEVSQKSIDEINNDIDNISVTEQPRKLVGELRERQFRKMYGDFTREVMSIAVERHNQVSSDIMDLFMQVMGIEKSNPDYEALSEDVANLCGLNRQENESYYQSLIERFARDMFEVQIKFVHGPDRFEKFQTEFANFLSLDVFYTQSVRGETGDSPKQGAFSDGNYLRLVLYPEYIAQDKVDPESVFGKVREMTGLKLLGPVLEDMLVRIVRNRGSAAATAIELALSQMSPAAGSNAGSKVSPAVLLDNAKKALEPLADAGEEVNILDRERYLEHRRGKDITDSYAQVKQEFEEDVLALRDGLLKAFVPAINLDKAFSAKETKLIEDIRHIVLNTEDFRKFVVRNLTKIKPEAMSEIILEKERKELDSAVMSQICAILDNIAAVPTASN